jgi:hypothetical protein
MGAFALLQHSILGMAAMMATSRAVREDWHRAGEHY